MKSFKIFSLIAIFMGVPYGGVWVFYWWGANKSHDAAVSNAIPKAPVDGQGAMLKDQATAKSPAVQGSANHNVEGETRSFAEITTVDSWMKSSGFSPGPAQEYLQQYTEEQLVALSEHGDRVATDALLDICFARGCEDDKIEMLAERGIVQGSLRAISSMSTNKVSTLFFGPHLSDQDAMETLIRAHAYLRLYDLRGLGEAKANDLFIEHRMKMFAERYPHLVPLSASDEQKIWDRARELYDYYQAERHKLGLGDFDNELPHAVKRFFGLL